VYYKNNNNKHNNNNNNYYYYYHNVADTGRTVLLTWVCMLAVAHPLANFRNNMHVMSNSLVCTQQKVVNSTAKLVKLALAPINGQSSVDLSVHP